MRRYKGVRMMPGTPITRTVAVAATTPITILRVTACAEAEVSYRGS